MMVKRDYGIAELSDAEQRFMDDVADMPLVLLNGEFVAPVELVGHWRSRKKRGKMTHSQAVSFRDTLEFTMHMVKRTEEALGDGSDEEQHDAKRVAVEEVVGLADGQDEEEDEIAQLLCEDDSLYDLFAQEPLPVD